MPFYCLILRQFPGTGFHGRTPTIFPIVNQFPREEVYRPGIMGTLPTGARPLIAADHESYSPPPFFPFHMPTWRQITTYAFATYCLFLYPISLA